MSTHHIPGPAGHVLAEAPGRGLVLSHKKRSRRISQLKIVGDVPTDPCNAARAAKLRRGQVGNRLGRHHAVTMMRCPVPASLHKETMMLGRVDPLRTS